MDLTENRAGNFDVATAFFDQLLRKLVNWSSTPMSLPRSRAITSWRVSRSLLTTRTVSPWMLAWAFFLESLMAATMILAFSEGMPWTSLIFWRTEELAAGSSFSNSRFLRETPRLTSF